MRILRVSQHLYPDVTGGMPYHVHAMSRDQAEMGHDVTVITTRSDDSLPREETRDGYEIRRFDTLVSPLGNDVSVGLARFLRRASEFDVVHAHSHLYFSTNLAALKRRFGDIPLAITNHGLYSQSAPERLFRWYLRTVGRWTFNQADVVFCYTETDRERVRELGVTTDIEVVPNGVDTERFTPDGPESELIDAQGPVVLFVGRLVEGKRPREALEAVQHVRKDRPDVALYFCGDGPLRSELEDEAGSDLGESVVFLGHVPHDEMPAIYRSADVLVQPSRAEGVPRTVLEAQASGKPVITSDLDQIEAVLTESSRAVEPENPGAMAEHIREVITNGTNPARELESGHDWTRTAETTTSTLEFLQV